MYTCMYVYVYAFLMFVLSFSPFSFLFASLLILVFLCRFYLPLYFLEKERKLGVERVER